MTMATTTVVVVVVTVVVSSTNTASSLGQVAEFIITTRQLHHLGGTGWLPLRIDGCATGRRITQRGEGKGGRGRITAVTPIEITTGLDQRNTLLIFDLV